MKRVMENFAKPYGFRDFEFVRAGPEGAYWKRADGMVVRVAAAEGERAPHAQRRTPQRVLVGVGSRARAFWRDLRQWCERREVRWLWRLAVWARRAVFAVHVASWFV